MTSRAYLSPCSVTLPAHVLVQEARGAGPALLPQAVRDGPAVVWKRVLGNQAGHGLTPQYQWNTLNRVKDGIA